MIYLNFLGGRPQNALLNQLYFRVQICSTLMSKNAVTKMDIRKTIRTMNFSGEQPQIPFSAINISVLQSPSLQEISYQGTDFLKFSCRRPLIPLQQNIWHWPRKKSLSGKILVIFAKLYCHNYIAVITLPYLCWGGYVAGVTLLGLGSGNVNIVVRIQFCFCSYFD